MKIKNVKSELKKININKIINVEVQQATTNSLSGKEISNG